jgi:hemerythrin HHE cation binding domain-containing protein
MTPTNSGPMKPGLTDTSDMPAVHQVFRLSLAAGPSFVASAAGSDERRALISNYYVNVIDFLEAHHEGEEQLVFPLLSERAAGSLSVVDVARQQHADVTALVEAAKAGMHEWESTGDTAAGMAVQSLQALTEVLIPHLDQEEAELLPLASRHLSVEEWGQLPGHTMRGFSGDKIWLILGLIRENFTDAQRQMLSEKMPPPLREMWESMGEAAFDSLIAEVRQIG